MTIEFKITEDGCVDEKHVPLLRKLPSKPYLVYAAGIEKVKNLVALFDEKRGDVLACPITGTLYDANTGRSSDFDLYIIQPLEPEAA